MGDGMSLIELLRTTTDTVGSGVPPPLRFDSSPKSLLYFGPRQPISKQFGKCICRYFLRALQLDLVIASIPGDVDTETADFGWRRSVNLGPASAPPTKAPTRNAGFRTQRVWARNNAELTCVSSRKSSSTIRRIKPCPQIS